MISINHEGTILYVPERGIQAAAAGHHPQRVLGCFVSSVQSEHFLKAIQTVSELGRLGVVANPSIKKQAIMAPKENKSAITINGAADFIEPFYLISLKSQSASINALQRSK
jgi:hypothetical protein